MDIIKIILISLLAVSLILIIKQVKPELAMLVSLVTITIIFAFCIDKVGQVIDLITRLSQSSGMPSEFLTIVLKIIGIAYLTEFGANVCKDVGESAIAAKIQFAGKCVIMLLGMTIIGNFVDTLTKLI
ncbi:MAG: stage III sporulation protein AD [Clostridia bacterium]|nr:stage III sporulation protein AD [Clostridia bacterium]